MANVWTKLATGLLDVGARVTPHGNFALMVDGEVVLVRGIERRGDDRVMLLCTIGSADQCDLAGALALAPRLAVGSIMVSANVLVVVHSVAAPTATIEHLQLIARKLAHDATAIRGVVRSQDYDVAPALAHFAD